MDTPFFIYLPPMIRWELMWRRRGHATLHELINNKELEIKFPVRLDLSVISHIEADGFEIVCQENE